MNEATPHGTTLDDPAGDPAAVLLGRPEDMFRVRVVAHSVTPDGHQAMTYRVTAPRVILAEINTHRMLSRSSESSRAIPVSKRIGQVETTPYRPMRFGKRVKGMGAGDSLAIHHQAVASRNWDAVRLAAVDAARKMADIDLAKEEVNRILEPWALCRTVITATEWANFYAQRTHEKAHPAFRFLARAMYVAARKSVPEKLDYGQWHLPLIVGHDHVVAEKYTSRSGATGRAHELASWPAYHLARWSAARCARVSYGLLDGRPANPDADDQTWAMLVGMAGDVEAAALILPETIGVQAKPWPFEPVHASPLEHPCLPLHKAYAAAHPRLLSNLRGYVQLRKLVGGENVTKFDPPAAVVGEWAAEIPAQVFDGQDLY